MRRLNLPQHIIEHEALDLTKQIEDIAKRLATGGGGGTVAIATNLLVTNEVALIDAVTVVTNAALGHNFTLLTTQNFTLANPTNAFHGQKIMYRVKQGGGGSKTITFDTKFRFGLSITSITLSTTAGKVDYIGCIYNSVDDTFDIIAFAKSF